jgi:hypothetical protein
MRTQVALFGLLFILGLHSPIETQQRYSIFPEQICAYPTRFVGPCVTIRGRLSYANGSPSVRMWKVGTHRLLGVEDESYQKPSCVLPREIRVLLNADQFVSADFVVRPLTVEQPEVMRRVCVVSAANVRTKPAYFIHPPPRAPV